MAKVTVNIPDVYYEASKRIAARDHTSVSALTARALRREILRADAAALVADGHTGSGDIVDLADEVRPA